MTYNFIKFKPKLAHFYEIASNNPINFYEI